MLPGTKTKSGLAPRCARSGTSDRSLAFAAAMRMVVRVHDAAADGRANTHVTDPAGFAVVDQVVLTVSDGSAATGTIKEGDQLIVNGYLYTVTEDLTLVSGAGTLKVDQNLPATISTAVSAMPIKKAHALGFHRNGLALVTRQLEPPMGASKVAVASADGLSIRVVFEYDATTKTDLVSFDIIYGITALDKSLLVDFS